MKVFKKIAIGLFFITSFSQASSVNNGLVYESNDEIFVLKKECVWSIRVDRQIFDSKINYSTSIKLKDRKECSRQLNSIIKNNIGGRLRTYFNSKLLMDSYIASELSTEKGFRMPVENEQLGKDIVMFYNDND